jgi:hypothetical protein
MIPALSFFRDVLAATMPGMRDGALAPPLAATPHFSRDFYFPKGGVVTFVTFGVTFAA